MKILEKIEIVTKNILNIYDDLMMMEIEGTKNNEKYIQKLENLKLLKEIEQQYYKELEKKYSLDELIKLKRNLNVDNIADSKISDLHFSTYYKTEEEIIKRRIYNNIDSLILDKCENDSLFNIIERKIGNFDYKRQSFILGDEEIFVLNHAKTFVKINQKVTNNLYYKYLYFIQLYINNNRCLTDLINSKYSLIFIDKRIEDELIKNNFKIKVKTINEISTSSVDQKIYDYLLESGSLNFLSLSISELLTLSDTDLKHFSSHFIVYFYEAIIRSSALQLNEETLQQFKNMINEVEEENFSVVKKKLMNIMNVTKNDKVLL